MPDNPSGTDNQRALFLFPIEIKWCLPANLGTADCGQICRGVDGCDYAIKDGKTGGSAPVTPHCEWFCTVLGERVGIAAPSCKVIRLPDGTLVFGSRWEGGVVKPNSTFGNWWDQVHTP